MSKEQYESDLAVEDWPTFTLRYVFNPDDISADARFKPDEVVCFDATKHDVDGRWIAAERGSYVRIEDVQ